MWNANISLKIAPITFDNQWAKFKMNRPFFYFCIMQKILAVIYPNSLWKERVKELIINFPDIDCDNISIQHFGLEVDWLEWELWRQAYIKRGSPLTKIQRWRSY